MDQKTVKPKSPSQLNEYLENNEQVLYTGSAKIRENGKEALKWIVLTDQGRFLILNGKAPEVVQKRRSSSDASNFNIGGRSGASSRRNSIVINSGEGIIVEETVLASSGITLKGPTIIKFAEPMAGIHGVLPLSVLPDELRLDLAIKIDSHCKFEVGNDDLRVICRETEVSLFDLPVSIWFTRLDMMLKLCGN